MFDECQHLFRQRTEGRGISRPTSGWRNSGTTIEGGTVGRLAVVQAATHGVVLAALPAEEECHQPRASFRLSTQLWSWRGLPRMVTACAVSRQRAHGDERMPGDRPAVSIRHRPGRSGVGGEIRCQVRGRPVDSIWRLCREHEQMAIARRRCRSRCRRLLENDDALVPPMPNERRQRACGVAPPGQSAPAALMAKGPRSSLSCGLGRWKLTSGGRCRCFSASTVLIRSRGTGRASR